jgi:hypothetical protein
MSKCSYCGKENDGGALRCAGCGMEFPGSRPPEVRIPRRFVEELRQERLQKVLQKQHPRRCRCGSTMQPVHVKGWFLLDSEDAIACASVIYQCQGCKLQVPIPATSMLVFLSVLAAIFGWCGLQFMDFRTRTFPSWPQILLILPFLAVAAATLALLVGAFRKRRDFPVWQHADR